MLGLIRRLKTREREISQKENALIDTEKSLIRREEAVTVAERELFGRDFRRTEGAKEALTEEDAALIKAALIAYGIDQRFVFKSRIDQQTGKAVIITHGGKKVHYSNGDKVEKLSHVQITGKLNEDEKLERSKKSRKR